MTKRDVLIVYILLYYALIPEDEQQELSARPFQVLCKLLKLI